MIKIENTRVNGFQDAIRGMRNPMNSWVKSDSGICKGGDNGIGCINCAAGWDVCQHTYDNSFQVGLKDYELMLSLSRGGPVHAKYRRFIDVYYDITAPLYWWKEFDTYCVGVCPNPTDIEYNSCSTMHKIQEKEFTLADFSHEHLISQFKYEPPSAEIYTPLGLLETIIQHLNSYRQAFLATNDKIWWWQMIQLLPTPYNQRRTVKLNYEVLADIYPMHKDHKLDEWHDYCAWIESLPYSKVITG